ncbi:DUF4829 domain-containing protein [Gottfriedia solisilvae]|uniref:DUF4829 domain-containing protein n=1 Tax=Gottfriedia solisilvae TaxID=1516104 RepID=UPI003D2F3B48
MKNQKLIFFFCLLIVVVFSSFLYKHLTDKVEVRIEKSNQFTEDEINTAIKTVKERFKYFKGCQLTDIWYSEKESNAITEDYMKYGRGSENGVKEKNVIVLLSNFTVDSSGGDGSFEPNSTQSDWSWTLIRDSKNDKWQVDSWGY